MAMGTVVMAVTAVTAVTGLTGNEVDENGGRDNQVTLCRSKPLDLEKLRQRVWPKRVCYLRIKARKYVVSTLHVSANLFNCLISILLLSSPAYSATWDLTPSLSIRQSYTDNVNLEPSGSESDAFISEVIPGFAVAAQGARLNFNLQYRMQNVLSSTGQRDNRINNQLRASGQAEVIPNSVFVDLFGNISQQNLNTVLLGSDNLSGANNLTDVKTFSVSPYWTPRFGGYANGVVRVRYGLVDSDNISDSSLHQESIRLRSGRRFSIMNWSLNVINSETNRDDNGTDGIQDQTSQSITGNNDVRFQNSSAEIRWRLTRKFNVFVQGGHANNNFRTNSDLNNGAYYLAGAGWTPNSMLRVEAGAGKNSRFASVGLNPTTRTTMTVTFRDRSVGTNTGVTWQGLFRHQTRRALLQARYFEDTVTTQQILLNLGIFGGGQQQIFQPRIGVVPTLTDEVFERKRSELLWSFNTAKSTYSLRAFDENREFQETDGEEKVRGLVGSWNWQFVRRMNSYLNVSWQRINRRDANLFTNLVLPDSERISKDKLYLVSVGVTRNIWKQLNGILEYRFAKQNSDDSDREYTENRLTAGVVYRY